MYAGCAPLYKIAAKQWTVRLKVQMTLYVVFVGVSMAMGGLLPWMLEGFHQGSSISNMNPSQKLFSTDVGYVYKTNNSYSFCPNYRIVHYGEQDPALLPMCPLLASLKCCASARIDNH
jgi:hypothetical protein